MKHLIVTADDFGLAREVPADQALDVIREWMLAGWEDPAQRELVETVRTSGGPPSAEQAAEMQRLQGRLAGAMKVAAVLVVAAAALMAVARYMPS